MAKENLTPAQIAAQLVVAFIYQTRTANDSARLLEDESYKNNDGLVQQFSINLENATKEVKLVRDRIGRRVVEDQFSGEIHEIFANLKTVYPTISEHLLKFAKDVKMTREMLPEWMQKEIPVEVKVAEVKSAKK